MKKEYLAAVLLLSGLSVGFFTGREFPRETLLEKECRVVAGKNTSGLLSDNYSRFMFANHFARCMRGGR